MDGMEATSVVEVPSRPPAGESRGATPRPEGNAGAASRERRATICQVLHGLQVGGAEVLAARLARQLGGEFRFVFACLDELGSLGLGLRDEGFTVEVLDRRPGLDGRCARRLAGIARRERADVLHAHQYAPSSTARPDGCSGPGPRCCSPSTAGNIPTTRVRSESWPTACCSAGATGSSPSARRSAAP